MTVFTAAAMAFGFSLGVVYKLATPSGGLNWKAWAALACVYLVVMLATKNAS